jgi:hypothetical protein
MTLNLRRNILQLFATITIGVVAGLAALAFHEAMIALAAGLVLAPSKWPWAVFGLSSAFLGTAALMPDG